MQQRAPTTTTQTQHKTSITAADNPNCSPLSFCSALEDYAKRRHDHEYSYSGPQLSFETPSSSSFSTLEGVEGLDQMKMPPASSMASSVARGADDDAASVISTTCSSLDEDDHTTTTTTTTSMPQKPSATTATVSASSAKRAVWKDKGGKARYVLNDDQPRRLPQRDNNNINKARQLAAAAVTAGVVTGSVVGLAVLGPLGLVVGGVGGVGSAASALVTQRRLNRQQQQQLQQKRSNTSTTTTTTTPSPMPFANLGHQLGNHFGRNKNHQTASTATSTTTTTAPMAKSSVPCRTFSTVQKSNTATVIDNNIIQDDGDDDLREFNL